MKNLLFKNRELIFLFVVLFIASVLILANLTNRCLWQDEAETALVSKTILQYSLPRASDGKNFYAPKKLIAPDNDYLWTLDPWLTYYLLAGFFQVFGAGTLTARLPFAFLGIATIILTYFFARLLCKNKKIAALSVIILLLCVPFLLLTRQCRYYSLAAFLSLLGLYGYLLLAEKTRTGSWLFCIAALLTFHTNHLFCAALLAGVCCHALLFHRKLLARTFILSALVVLLCLPWLIWISRFRYITVYGYNFFNMLFFLFFERYILHIHDYIFPLYLLLIPLVKVAWLGFRHKSFKTALAQELTALRCLRLPLVFVFISLFALSLFSPATFFRYITQLIPVLCVIPAVLIYSLIKPRFKTGLVLILLAFFAFSFIHYYYHRILPEHTSGKNALPQTDYYKQITIPYAQKAPFVNIFDYFYEITSDYHGPIEGIVKYLQINARDDDIVAITYGGLPVMFYTNLKVICGSTGEDLSLVRKAQWIILRKYDTFIQDSYDMRLFILQNLPLKHYRKIVIDYPDIPWSNRPDPLFHEFRTPLTPDRVIIYRQPAVITWP